MFNSKSFYEKDENLIYNLINIQYDTLFFTLDATSGSLKRQYIWNDYANCYLAYKFQRFGDRIYMAFGCQVYLAITVYTVSDNTFVVAYRGDASLRRVVFTPLQAFFAYSINSNEDEHFGYFKRGPIHSVNAMYNFNFESFRMIYPVARYYTVVQNETMVEYNMTNRDCTPYDPIAENTQMSKTIVFNHTSDTEFFLEPLILGDVLNNYEYKEDITLTCSRGGLSSISFKTGNFSNYPIPEWAKVNPDKGSLNLNVPYSNDSVAVKFTIDAIVESENKPRTYSKLVLMNLKSCYVSDCYKCEQGQQVNTCLQCIGK